MIRALAIVLVLASCGSKPPAEPAAAPTQKQTLPPELEKFHAVLEPHWEATPGAQRMKDSCAALPDFQADANDIAKATPPVGANADTWTTATKQLVDAVADLDAACQTIDPAQFDAAFAKVHDAFHALMTAAGATKM
jgi:hypothetical protein